MPWSDDLEQLNAETDTHWIDAWTRETCLHQLRRPAALLDVGCGSGALLDEAARRFPTARLAGVDANAAAAARTKARLHEADIREADAAALPFEPETFDAIVSTNVLEHIDDDVSVIRELARVLQHAGRLVLVVPYGPGLFDYYDRHLGHVRRYGRGELRRKVGEAGLAVVDEFFIGSLVYPGFWLVKKAARLRPPAEPAASVRKVVRASQLAGSVRSIEMRLPRMPFGVRNVLVASR